MADLVCRRCGGVQEHSESREREMIHYDERLKREREEVVYVGDGLRAPDPGEMVGRLVNINGRRGKIVKSGPLVMTVEWESSHPKSWLGRLINSVFGE